MEDAYLSYLENNVPTLKDICIELEKKGVQTTEDNVRNAIQKSNIFCKDAEGNYTGSKRMLITPFNGKTDLQLIKAHLER